MSKKIINNLFGYAAAEGAGRLVIENRSDQIACDYHFSDGDKQSFGLPKKLEKTLMDSLRQVLKIAPGELATKKYCKIYDKNYQLAFYLSILPDQLGEKIIINIINRQDKFFHYRQLGWQVSELNLIKQALKWHSGLILISSPIGQGKTTTLLSLLQELNHPEKNIYFLEKGSKSKITGLNYLENNEKNWEKILNHDCEIIALEEISDDKTFKNAFRAASTGRLVLATINAQSSWEVLLKVLKLSLPLKLKLDSLRLIINQRVVQLKRAKNKKTPGRKEVGLFEILSCSPDMKQFILDRRRDPSQKKFWEKLAQLAIKSGFKPLTEDLKKKIKNGLLSKEDYL